MDSLPVVVYTNDRHLFLLKGFSYLWNKYSNKIPVIVGGFSEPSFSLPENFTFLSLGKQLPVDRWSNDLIRFVNELSTDRFILLLEDFWLFDYTDWRTIYVLSQRVDDDVLRIDLSDRRAKQQEARTIYTFLNYHVIETPSGTPHQAVFNPSIWYSRNLLKILRKDENPWLYETEEGTRRAGSLRVLGIRPAAIHYRQVWRCRRRRWEQLNKLQKSDFEYIKKMGWFKIPREA